MEILNTDINNRRKLNKLGYNSDIYYCGNYSMQKYYSYIYNFMRNLGIKFALNRACFIHDLNYNKKPSLYDKTKIDWQFFCDMQKCIMFEYKKKNINLKHSMYLRIVACLFYAIVVLATPFYINQDKIKK